MISRQQEERNLQEFVSTYNYAQFYEQHQQEKLKICEQKLRDFELETYKDDTEKLQKYYNEKLREMEQIKTNLDFVEEESDTYK